MRRVALILSLLLVVAACGGDDAEESTTSTADTTTSSSTTTTRATTTTTRPTTTVTDAPGPTSPINGLELEDPEAAERRTLVVKIDNHPNARPQSGLPNADAVVELPVEGITRLVGIFHTGDSVKAGPIRSVRPTDWQVATLFDGVLVISGGQRWIIAENLDHDVGMIGDLGRPVTFRSGDRDAPHNLYGDTVAIRELADDRGYDDTAPDPIWEFGPLPDGEPAREITVDFSDSLVAGWEWDGEAYLRTTNGAIHEWIDDEGTTERIRTDVIVVMFTDSGLVRPPPGGSTAMAVESIGTGRALVFAEGRVVAGTWSRSAADSPITLETEDGEPLPVPPGKPWITFVPREGTVDW
jgi:hypothetical protein